MDIAYLITAVARLARAATEEFTAADLLRELCTSAATVPGVDGAAVMVLEGNNTRFVTASAAGLFAVEHWQELLQQGPCSDSVDTETPVTAVGAAELERWPAYGRAVNDAGFAAVLVLPLLSHRRGWGALTMYRRQAEPFTAEQTAIVRMLADVAVSYLALAADREHAQATEQHLTTMLMHDQLTGLPNRGLIYELIFHAMTAAKRHGTLVAVLFVDLDHFKVVNDTHGHHVGDAVLQAVAHRLRGAVRTADTVARLSGDEFLVLCEDLGPTVEPELSITHLAERIRDAVTTDPILVGDVSVIATISVGVCITGNRPSVSDLVHQADLAMYEAKARGANLIVVRYHPDDHSQGRGELESSLFQALPNNELRVHYQPIVSADGTFVAVEALLRWQHPDRGLLHAGEFIELAESTGAIVAIGQWAIGRSLAQLSDWQHRFPATAPGMVFCNLSPREAASPDLAASITASLTSSGMRPVHLGLEITETGLGDPRLASALGRFQKQGHPLAIDDFGTGYSSLYRLIDLPAAYVKLDRSLIANLPGDVRSRSLVDAVLVIAAQLDLTVIGEGVENQRQADYLTGAGCALQQGFYHSRPVAADAISLLLRRPRAFDAALALPAQRASSVNGAASPTIPAAGPVPPRR